MQFLFAGFGLVHFAVAIASFYFWLTGLIAAFKVTLLAGIVTLFVPPLAAINGLLLLFDYNLVHNIALALNMV